MKKQSKQEREIKILRNMLKALVLDAEQIQERGAGYYSSAPFVQRYNKLLAKALSILKADSSELLSTFSPLEDTTSVDPADKMKVLGKLIVEANQLIAYIESLA